jgi:signal transduction histidine kinase
MDKVNAEQLLDALSDGITVQDLDFNIIYQNRAMREIFGSHVGKKCYAIYEKRCKVCEECGILKVMKTGQPSTVLRAGVLDSGATGYFENACIPLFNDAGQVIAGVEMCRNVTDRVQLEAQVKDRNLQLGQVNDLLEQQKVELQQALAQREEATTALVVEMERRIQLEAELRQKQKLEAIGQLAAGIAHEINTPLQYITDNTVFVRDAFQEIRVAFKQFYERLQAANGKITDVERVPNDRETAQTDDDLDHLMDEVPKAIQESLEGTERVTEIVRAMKEFSHPNATHKTPADLNGAIRSAVTIAGNEWKNVAAVEMNLDPQLPPVPCLWGEFCQAILNIVVNAAQAIAEAPAGPGHDKGKITIASRLLGSQVEIRISDTGPGIPQAIQSKIFDPFFTTKPIGKGTGQGLSVAYAVIVGRHGGSLDVETQLGQGTTFIIKLPLAAA